jgi:multidrug efflux pump subunit AcrA (membrane-fusion protein)
MGAALPFASLALGALGTAASVAGQGRQAAADAGQANYLSQVARNNQLAAERNADRARQQGEVDAAKQQLATAGLEGRQRAQLASQGGDVDSGSPLDVLGDTARAGATDAATIRSNAALKAYGYDLQAGDAAATARDEGFRAANATAALPFTTGASLLGAASGIAGKWPR